MSTVKEIRARWDGDGNLQVIARDLEWCNANLVVGYIHKFEPIFERDMNRHSARFATLVEAFKQLPHEYDGVYRNFDHFRKTLLVQEGYCTVENLIFDTPEDALRSYPFIQKINEMNPADKDFAFVEMSGRFIRITHPFSMSVKAMRDKVFYECSNRLIDRACSMIGVSREELRENAGKQA